jgi:hypothetical protein
MGYWEIHGHLWGVLYILGLACLPRITTLFFTGPFGCLGWVGWLFVPHLLVAFWATTHYWHTNPILCVGAWIWALVGTGGEGKFAHSKAKRKQ